MRKIVVIAVFALESHFIGFRAGISLAALTAIVLFAEWTNKNINK